MKASACRKMAALGKTYGVAHTATGGSMTGPISRRLWSLTDRVPRKRGRWRLARRRAVRDQRPALSIPVLANAAPESGIKGTPCLRACSGGDAIGMLTLSGGNDGARAEMMDIGAYRTAIALLQATLEHRAPPAAEQSHHEATLVACERRHLSAPHRASVAAVTGAFDVARSLQNPLVYQLERLRADRICLARRDRLVRNGWWTRNTRLRRSHTQKSWQALDAELAELLAGRAPPASSPPLSVKAPGACNRCGVQTTSK